MALDRDAIRSPLLPTGVIGIVAYLLGYLLSFLWTGGTVWGALADVELASTAETGDLAAYLGTNGVLVPAWKGAGWLFNGAHFVPLATEAVEGSVNLVAAARPAYELLYLVPPVVLVGGGALAARAFGGRTVWHSASAGALVFLGYLPLSLAGTLAFSVGTGATLVHPKYLPAAAVAGVAYPVVFGSLGGVLGHELRERRASRESGVTG
jgi:hypothetical protein